jgi:uncharacterized protein involved in exopolysaccharide biosynthesis
MNEPYSIQRNPESIGDNEIGLIDLLIALARHKLVLVAVPLAAAVISIAITFALPNIYRASTKLLPPQQAQSGAAALLSQLGGAAGLAAGVAGIKSPTDVYVGMLKSRTVADRLIEKFNLKKVYETSSQERARRELEENTIIGTGKEGFITIDVEDENRKLAAQLANAYADELQKFTDTLAVTEAAQRRMFFQRQLEQSKNSLAKAEMALKSTLDSHGVVSVDAETRAVVETTARLRAQISAKEIQLNSMRSFVTANHPEFLRTQQELSSLQAELSKLRNGSADTAVQSPSTNDKANGFENIQLLRDVKYYQMLYELLAKQYEIARLDEAKDPSVVQVLDGAVEPEHKFKPKRGLIVILATIAALFFTMCWIFFVEAKKRALSSEKGKARWAELKRTLKFKQN